MAAEPIQLPAQISENRSVKHGVIGLQGLSQKKHCKLSSPLVVGGKLVLES